MNTTTLIIVVALVVAALALLLLMRGKTKPADTAAPDAPETGHGLADAAAVAIEDTVGQFVGVDMTPELKVPEGAGAPDVLTTIKGLGPKAAAQLNALGITRYDQLAGLDADAADALDARMGTFKGRIGRDRWIEQASHLAAGDREGFEAKFGKLG